MASPVDTYLVDNFWFSVDKSVEKAVGKLIKSSIYC